MTERKNKLGPGLKFDFAAEKKTEPKQTSLEDVNLEYKNDDLRITIDQHVLEDLEELGAGNGGAVMKSRHKTENIILARKIIPMSSTKEQLKLILSELNVMHRCKHARIVLFYGSFYHDGSINIIMEYMDLGSLDRVCKKSGGKLSEQVASKIAVGACEGLDYLHTKLNILHRDIKPSNILLNRKGEIKLCDLGVSGELLNSVARTFVGTSWYMAPERVQSASDDYGRSSESWSLGLTLMEIVIGRFPFPPDGSKKLSAFEIMTYIVQDPPPVLPATFSIEFQDFIKQSLEKNKMKRPTPSQLMIHPFIVHAIQDPFDMEAWAMSLP